MKPYFIHIIFCKFNNECPLTKSSKDFQFNALLNVTCNNATMLYIASMHVTYAHVQAYVSNLIHISYIVMVKLYDSNIHLTML